MTRPRKTPAKQRTLFDSLELRRPAAGRHGGAGDGGTGTGPLVESQVSAASVRARALTQGLMERVTQPANLGRAWRRVKANQGAPGIDRQTIANTEAWLVVHGDELLLDIREQRFRPVAVRGVQIPKPTGGVRQLGIPTVTDRLVQQMLLLVLEPWFDPFFSDSSFGFRPGRSAHDALRRASKYVADGRGIAVDIDLASFFDRVNHDVLMSRLARCIGDARVLRLIRRFLEAGLMQDGVCVRRSEGTPQGGPLSPLLSNILLDELDGELERRGHCFVRYADDCTVYVRTQAAGERVMQSLVRFIEDRLKLVVNRKKSAVAPVQQRKLLGYRLLPGGRLGIAPSSAARMKDRVRQLTRRNRGVSLGRVIEELRRFLIGWVRYFRLAVCESLLRSLDSWIRRKLRCYRLKQCKRPSGVRHWLLAHGVPLRRAAGLASSRWGWWRKSGSLPASEGMSTAWLTSQGLPSLVDRYLLVAPR